MEEYFSFSREREDNNPYIDSSIFYRPRKEKPEETFKNSVCSFISSGANEYPMPEPVMAERPLMLQSQTIVSETWQGEVIKIGEESITIDIRNIKHTTVRRILRVSKTIVKGDIDSAFVGMKVSLLYTKQRGFQWEKGYKEVVSANTEIRLRQPVIIPQEARRREVEEKLKRYSYMFADDI